MTSRPLGRGVLLVLAAAGLSAACPAGEPGPPEVAYGLDECSYCRMIVSEERYAAAARSPDGTAAFDDVGCLAAAVREGRAADATVWVHDAESGAWLDATAAWYVRGDASTTPMGSGRSAVYTEAAARRLAASAGDVYRWEGLLTDEPSDARDDKENRG